MKRIVLLAIVFAFSAGVAVAQKTAEEFYNLGIQQRKDSKYAEAIKSQTECIRLNPKDHRCYLERGSLYSDAMPFTTRENFEAEYKQAINDYTEAIRLKPDYTEAYQKRAAKYYYGKREYEKAFPDYSQLLKLKPAAPSNDIIHYLLGTIYRSSATINGVKGPNYDKAIEEFTIAIKLPPREESSFLRPDYFRDRGQAYLARGEYDKAIADYTEALKLKPEHSVYNFIRAEAYEKKGEYDKALQDLSVFFSGPDRDYLPAIHMRAAIYCKTGKQSLAAADEKRAAEIGVPVKTPCKIDAASTAASTTATEKTAEQHYGEGINFFKQKNFDSAIASFDKCTSLQANAFPCFLFRANANTIKGNLDAALSDYNRAIQINPNLPNAYAARGVLYLKLQKKDLAAVDFRAALKIEPDHRQAKQGLQMLGLQP
jgi:tetratricopeptide (TPR) repeat protein